MPILSFLLMRFLEPSSYAGLAIAANAAASIAAHGPSADNISQGIGGMVAFFMPAGLSQTQNSVSLSPQNPTKTAS